MAESKPYKIELFLFFIAAAMVGFGIYYFGPSITSFAIKEFSYADATNLLVTANGSYAWQPDNAGDIKSVKMDGKVTTYGRAKIYIESNGIRYLVFDSSKLNENNGNASANIITGLAVKEENDKDKKDKNKKPDWNGANQFIINGTTLINLSQYFTDKDNDVLIYSASSVEGLDTAISNEMITMTPKSNNDFNTTITFTASDGIDSTSQIVDLIVNVNINLINETINTTPTINITINQTPINQTSENLSINITPILNETQISNNANETNQIINNQTKTIAINLSYNSGTIYDANDNGEESVNGVVDLTVSGTKFGWDADASKLCARWEVYSIEDAKLTTFCNGNSDCCAFVGLLPTKDNWSEIYYSAFGKDDAGHNNLVSAQVLYYDVNLSAENTKSEIYYSDWENKTVKFFEEETEFSDVCLDTCSLKGLNKSSYNIVFEIEDNAVLRIDKIKYSVSVDVQNSAPLLLQNFSAISVSKNKNIAINLSQYFADPDGDSLTYSYYKPDNITIMFDKDTATVIPDKDVEGVRFTYFAANDSEKIAVSNVFMINISQEKFKPRVEIGKPVRWQRKILIDVNNVSSVNLTLPETASNITIRILNQTIQEELPDDKIKFVEDGKVKNKELFEAEQKLDNVKKKISILEEAKRKKSLKVSVDEQKFNANEINSKLNELYSEKSEIEQQLNQLNPANSNLITANVVALTDTTINATQPILFINESLLKNTEVQIEYETEAPIAVENEINQYTKQVKVISDIHYEDVLSYTTLDDVPQNSIKLYWLQNGEKTLFENVNYLDENNDGMIDKIEWTIPHLSNQTFEVTITVLNVQSYPTVGGNWTVVFNTTGTGNLTIFTYGGTSYAEKEIDDSLTSNDLDVLELKCDANVLEPLYIVDFGNISLEGLTAINGDVVKNVEEKGFRGLLTLNSLDESPFQSGNALASKANINEVALYLNIPKNSIEKEEKSGFHSLANAPRQNLISTRTKDINQSLFKYLSLEENSKNKENKKSFKHVEIAQPEIKYKLDMYLNIPDDSNFSAVERVRSLTDKALLWLRRGCGFENGSEIPSCPHSCNNIPEFKEKEIINQAHSLDKTPVWLRRVSHEFLLDSETAESHTVELKKKSEYKNVSVLDDISNFFSIIPSAYAQTGNSSYLTFDFNGKTYALLTKEQLQWHSYKIIGVYYQDYNCDNLTGYWTVHVLTAGVHNQRFNFSNQIADAHNFASLANQSTNGSVLRFVDDNDTDFLKGTLNGTNVSGAGGAANVTLFKNNSQMTNIPNSSQFKGNVSLVGFWQFNEGTGSTTADSSQYGKTGTLGSAAAGDNQEPAWNSTSKFGAYALTFSGVSTSAYQYINITDSTALPTIQNNFTVEAWFKTNVGRRMALMSRYFDAGSCCYMWFSTIVGGKLSVEFFDTLGNRYAYIATELSVEGVGPLVNDSNWHHTTIVWDVDRSLRLYADGVQIGESTSFSGTKATTTQPTFTIGMIGGTPTTVFFNGTMDEVAFWNITLDNATILDHYTRGVGFNLSGNFTSQVFDAQAVVNWSYISWSQEANDKGVSNLYQADISDLINSSTILYMKFNNDTLESERQLNVSTNISNEPNLVLYMPFDSASASEIKPNGSTVLLMHFNNDTGTGENASLFLNNASSFGGVPNGTCNLASAFCPIYNDSNAKLGKSALKFDGTDDYVEAKLQGPLNFTGSNTIEMWIKKDSIGTIKSLVSRRNVSSVPFNVEIRNTGKVDYDIDGPTVCTTGITVSGNTVLTSGDWYHVAAVYEAGTRGAMYINGILDAETFTSVPSAICPNNASWYIGAFNTGDPPGQAFDGYMDEVAIWNISLSSSDIAKHSGYGIDKSIYGNNATLMKGSNVNFTNCKFGECMFFGGTAADTNHINISDTASLKPVRNISVEGWAKFEKAGAYLVDKRSGSNGYQLQLGGLTFQVFSTGGEVSASASASYNDGNWHHFAGTYDGTTSRVYADGVLAASTSGTGGDISYTGVKELTIGSSNGVGTPLNGTIDEVAIWNISLSADKISEHAGAKIVDYSQYGNNGTRNFNSTSDFGRNFTDGKFSKGLVFDAINDYINVTTLDISTYDTSLTIETWIKTNRPSGGKETHLIEAEPMQIFFRQNSPVDAIEFNSGTTVKPRISIGDWHHLAFVCNNVGRFTYVDGQLATESGNTNLCSFTGRYVIIGNFYGGGDYYFNGSFDELSIWNVSLSADDIKKHYERGVLKLNLNYRTSNDNSTWTNWTGASNNTLSAITSNSIARFFQYKADFNTTDAKFTPILNNVSINYSLRSNLSIFDDTELRVVIANELFNFTANFTDGVNPINGTNINCTLSHNGTGNWIAPVNMNYAPDTKIYYYTANFTNKTIALFNVTCDGTVLGYNLMRTIDDFNVSAARVSNFNGSTNDFNNLNAFDNINNAVLEISPYGKIVWLNPINVTGADLNRYVNISRNNVGIFAENVHRTLNTSANITIYGIPSLVSPRILKNNVTCPETECKLISYNGANVTFNATSFSNFSLTNGSINLTLNLNATAVFTGNAVAVSGKVNLSNGSNLIGHLVRLFLNNVEYYNALNVTDNSDADFNKSVDKNATVVQGTGGGANVTLADWDYDPDRNLSVNLTAYWKFDEKSGNRSDYRGSNNLNDSNTVTSTIGVRENAANFTSNNAEYLATPDKADLSTGNIDFTVAAWVYPETDCGCDIIGKDNGAAPNREWNLYRQQAGAQFLIFGSDGTSNAVTGPVIPIGQWSFVVAWHDAAANTINIQLNNGAVTSASTTITLTDTAATVRIGAVVDPPENFFNGAIDEVAFWKRLLTAKERSILYNASNSTATPYLAGNTFKPYKGNFTSRVFEQSGVVNWTYISWGAPNNYGNDLYELVNASTVLYMKFDNESRESEKQLNATHNISAETNLVLYMPFDSASASEIKPNGSTVLLMHFNNDTGSGENASLFLNNATNSVGGLPNGTCDLANAKCPVFNMSNARLGAAGLEFDGSNDFVNVSNSTGVLPLKSGPFSFEAWVNTNSLTANNQIMGQGIPAVGVKQSLALDGTGTKFHWSTDANAVATLSTTTVNTNTWYHVAGTYDGSVQRIYVNGVLQGSDATTAVYTASATTIGMSPSGVGAFWNGTLDEVAVWNISLSSGIIAQHSGYGIDRSIYGNNASLMNGSVVNFTNKKFGEAMEFDKDFIEFSDTPFDFTSSITIEGWIYLKTSSITNEVVIWKSDAYGIGYGTTGANGATNQFGFSLKNVAWTTVNSSQTETLNTWHHVAGMFDDIANTISLYVDGILKGTTSFTTAIGTSNEPFRIGDFPNPEGGWFNGTIDEVAIWNKTLSSDLIAQHAGAKVLDYSQYGNNGTRNFNSTSDFGRNFTDGKFSKALVFDGVNDYVNLSNRTHWQFGTNDFVLEAWVKPAIQSQGNRAVFSKYEGENKDSYIIDFLHGSNQWRLYVFNSAGTRADTACGSMNTADSFPEDEWQHIVYVQESDASKFYVNGVVEFSCSPFAQNIGGGKQSLIIGQSGLDTEYWNGTIDEVAIWNISLSADDIRKHYERGVLKLDISTRASNDSTTFTAWQKHSNKTLSVVNYYSRYLQYKADFNTTDARYTPILNNVTINFTGILTNAFGIYNFSLTAPATLGYHTVKVNTTFENTLGNEKNATLTVLQTINIAPGGLFEIRDASNNRLAVFDSAGNLHIKGGLTQNSEPSADTNDFAIQNSTGGLNMVITNPEGNLLIKNSINQNQASPLSPTLNSLVIQNSTGAVVAYANSTGGLFLTGTLAQFGSFG